MKVLVNASPLMTPRTGIGQYIHNLFSAMERVGGADLRMSYGSRIVRGYSNAPEPGVVDSPFLRKLALKVLPRPRAAKRLVEGLMFRYQTRHALRDAIYHEPNYLPIKFEGPLVLTVCDMSCFDHPETHPKERVRLFHEGLPPALERADHVLVISQDSKRALQRWFGVPDERITVTYLAAAPSFRPLGRDELLGPLVNLGLSPKGYVLTVGTLEPRKNLSTLFAAFAGLPKQLRQRFPLVVVGMMGWKYDELLGNARALVDEGELRFLGYLDDVQMPAVYAGAAAFCYPSRYEGFGLPALEAMASGVPVLTSNATSLPEVVGAAGLMVDPDDVGGMRDSLASMLEDAELSARLVGLGLERAASFSWERCAEETLGVYRKVARAHGLKDSPSSGERAHGEGCSLAGSAGGVTR
ncbi:MAG: hypothetical protein B7Y59_11200 [Burkholderiales bacterium 35-55-47]|jgi:alpha-1,3-rhamnosyl/mannosyltransferase|uniref:glycosyltransferase family 4 protein n=1 Tax=Limnohabitans sp. TaxID=1907725 RepID=UPI000BD495DB|nr:glycosyltransferase family 1 protein [Limnohabitans sp.]OYY17867.1 MAG: hypothetical protein B7Y59_11200 [Burkholderiales bacterium 35-55-47]OYZ72196.1 MAG: hypothetical protein B7Y06_11365 [Burkholderiales bacterium 24-55-52]OZA99568.1 MAG: hypothetical protein B7X62_09850 [Burkholderiales bacterium 39-55-53]HQR86831.1 glycosyltransferase family 1 protein [Limnohabitans sp.]HQS27072.1 glycosyltransferase family 1 protein [Limnohabitans sp.]